MEARRRCGLCPGSHEPSAHLEGRGADRCGRGVAASSGSTVSGSVDVTGPIPPANRSGHVRRTATASMRRPGEQVGRPSPGTVGGRISTVHAQSCSGLPRLGHADLDRDGKAAASSAGASCTPTHRMPAVRRASRAAVSAGEQSPARTSSVTIAHQAVPSDTVRVVSHPCWQPSAAPRPSVSPRRHRRDFPPAPIVPAGLSRAPLV